MIGADDADGLRARLESCLAVPRWAVEVAASAPFGSLEELVHAAVAAATPLGDDEVRQALAGHPRIGEDAAGSGAGAELSRREQASLGPADAAVETEFREESLRYERRFGRVFLIRAAGRTRVEVLAELHRRSSLTPREELDEVAEQLRQIAVLRIRALFADG